MNTKPLELFTNPTLLAHINRNILERFLEDMKRHLPPEAASILAAGLPHEEFCATLATQFRSPGAFGAPLRQALCDIETLALPENTSLLKDALDHLPRGYDVNQNLPSLHQALHLWLIAQNTPGVTFPISSPTLSQLSESFSFSSSFSSSSSPPDSDPASQPAPNTEHAMRHESSPIIPGVQIKNQKSKIENSDAPRSDAPLSDVLARLAKLNPLDYDLIRRSEAKRLKLRLRTLDDAVERARSLDDDAQVNAVRFRQIIPWPDPIPDSPALFDEVHDRGLRYLYLPPGAAVVITVWAAHSHVIRAFTQTPRLNFTSTEPGCGKSTALSFLVPLCPKVLRTDNLKTPVLFRVVERHDPTVVLDEVDSYLHLCPDLLGLLNAGHDPDACVLRCEGNHVRAFKCFAATALAGIGHLSPTLRDRSIIIPLTKAPPGSLQARFDKRKLDAENILGQKIARWAQDNFDAIAICDPPMPTHNRLADNWRPLFAVAQIIGGHWPQRILDAFHSLTNSTRMAVDAATIALLADIRTVFAQLKSPCVSSKHLVNALLVLPNRSWAPTDPAVLIDETWLAARLRSLGIRPHNVRFADRRAKGYELDDFTHAFGQLLKDTTPSYTDSCPRADGTPCHGPVRPGPVPAGTPPPGFEL